MEAVNLLPEYARGGRRWTTAGSDLSSRRILPIGGVAAIGLALLFGLFYFHERSLVSDKKSELATAQALIAVEGGPKIMLQGAPLPQSLVHLSLEKPN